MKLSYVHVLSWGSEGTRWKKEREKKTNKKYCYGFRLLRQDGQDAEAGDR